MSSISENTKRIAVVVLAGNESGFELIIIVIAVKHRFVIFSLNVGLHRTGTKLINQGNSRQHGHYCADDWCNRNIGKHSRTKHQLKACQTTVDAIAQRGMHGFKVKGISDVEFDVVHGCFLLISLFWKAAVALAVAQVGKEPEHFRLASASYASPCWLFSQQLQHSTEWNLTKTGRGPALRATN